MRTVAISNGNHSDLTCSNSLDFSNISPYIIFSNQPNTVSSVIVISSSKQVSHKLVIHIMVTCRLPGSIEGKILKCKIKF